MMMESWADHCSSDEEELKRVPSASAFAAMPDDDDDDFFDEVHGDVGLDTSNDGGTTNFFNQNKAPPQPQKPVPNSPPYTAFMNNLNYDVTEDELAIELEKICHNKKHKISVLNVRFAFDRETKKRKGFGYVEVSTRDDLVTLLKLSPISIFGRNVRIDVATNTRKQSNNNNNSYRNNNNGNSNNDNSYRSNNNNNNWRNDPPISRSSNNSLQQMNVPDGIDGSKFRGGAIKRSVSKGSSSSLHKHDPQHQQELNKERGEPNAPSRPRTRLNLKPRSKPVQKNEGSASQQSSIFGTGKKRDGKSHVKAKEQTADTTNTTKEHTTPTQQKPQQATSPKNGDKATTTTNTKPSTSNKHTSRARKGATNIKSSHSKDTSKKYESNSNNNNTTTNNKNNGSGNNNIKKNKRSNKKTIVKEDGWAVTATTASESTAADIPVVTKKVEPPNNDETVKKSKAKNKVNVVKNHFAALGFDDDSGSD